VESTLLESKKGSSQSLLEQKRPKANKWSGAFKKLFFYPYYLKSKKAFRVLDSAGIEIVGVCNLKCTMCGYNGERKTGLMSYELFSEAIAQLKEFEVKNVALHVFGEPLLHPRIVDFVDHAGRNGFQIDLYTNSSKLDASLAERLIQSGLRQSHTSFIPNKKKYEEIFEGSDYDEVVKNMASLVKIIERNRLDYYFQIRLMTNSEDEFITYKNICSELFDGSTSVSYARSPFYPVYGQKMKCESPNGNNLAHPCVHIYRSINVLWNGDVVPCCFDLNGLLVMGNIKEKSLAKIWNNEKYVGLRSRLAKNKDLPEPCLSCFARYYKEHPLKSLLKRKLPALF